MATQYDFSGYVTKNDLKCGDGRTIRRNAFKDCDGQTVPLMWQHVHGQMGNVLGHVLLENRDDGMYGYGSFNDTEEGKMAKEYVKHGDIKSMSIYANRLVEKGGDVLHGMIREVSLVLAGANPGAMIDNITIAHSDGSYDTLEDEAIIYSDSDIQFGSDSNIVSHSDDDEKEDNSETNEEEGEEAMETEISHEDSERTVADVLDTFDEDQKEVMTYLIGLSIEKALADAGVSNGAVEHSDMEEDEMHKNIFDKSDEAMESQGQGTLSHSEMVAIFNEAKDQKASLKETFLAHGITNIDYLFPDTKLLNKEPQIINDDQEWVSAVMNGVHKSPFSRLKTIAADITIDEARAVGYVKGTKKVEEQFGLLKRQVTPKTIYKKQKFDRDDILDITDLDVVAWVKSEMQIKLKEEIARAILVGDGRLNSDPNKIDEDKVIPIYKDVSPLIGYNSQINGHNVSSATFAFRKTIEVPSGATDADKAELMIDEAVRARVDYKGSGSPTLYIGPAKHAEMLLIKDSMGRRIYESDTALATAMRVKNIVDVPIFDEISRIEDEGEETEKEFELAGIIVNLADYTIGLDKGGQTTMFDDFDIDYNQYKYLLETRLSGMLTKPFSAIILEYTDAESEG